VLRQAGVLGAAGVHEVTVEESRRTILSRIMRLRLRYDGAAADAPGTVILKTVHPDRIEKGWHGGVQEVAFYSDIAASMPPGLVLRCFEAHCDAATKQWHLLLEDLTDTHTVPTAWPLPPSQAQCARIIDAHARCHAAWWDDPRLGASVGTFRDAASVGRNMAYFATCFARFLDRVGDDLSAERRALFERLQDAAPRLILRGDPRRNLTVTHGDAHVWNCFLPRDGGDDVRLFDWDSWRVRRATTDLAYMMAIHWYPDRRRRLEPVLLDRYHATLLAHGVSGYDRQALQEGYRLAVLWQITTPVLQAVHDIPPVVWWNNLERILLAVDDLGCRDLLT
jgi:hypothetical protein